MVGAPDHLGKVIPLRRDRQVPVSLAPVVHRFQRAGEAALRRDLANDVLALHRPPPDVGEAEEVERRGRRHPVAAVGTPPAEVHIARLGFMEREPVSTQTFAQRVKHSLAAVPVFKGDDKVIGESHQLAPSVETRLRHFLEPLVQHMVQVAVPLPAFLPTGKSRISQVPWRSRGRRRRMRARMCESRLGMVIQGRIRNLGLSTTSGRFFSRDCGVQPMKLSRGASFHAAVEKPSMAMGQPFRSWTA